MRLRARVFSLVGAAAVAACGADNEREATPSISTIPRGTTAVVEADPACRLVIYVTREASQKNIARVEAYLDSDEAMVEFEFVTAEEKLDEIRKDNPDLVEALSENPLPHEFRARLRPSADAQEVVARYRALELPSVLNLRYQRDLGVGVESCA